MKLTIIGNGVMGSAFATSLKTTKGITANIIDKNNKTPEADIYLFAVKPQDFTEAALRLKGIKGKTIISIMAGVNIAKIKSLLPGNKIVRSTPNLGARVGESMTVWTTKSRLTPKEKTPITKILKSVGVEIEVKNEDLIDAATAIAGSGPAYIYHMADTMIKAAQQYGFAQQDAETLVKQMLIGTSKTWESSKFTASELQEKVTSKKGTTDAGIKEMKKHKLAQALTKGVKAAYKRAKELSKL